MHPLCSQALPRDALLAPALIPCTEVPGVWAESVLRSDILWTHLRTKPAQSLPPQWHGLRNLLGGLEAEVAAGAGWEVHPESPRGCRAGGAPSLGPPGEGYLGRLDRRACQAWPPPSQVPARGPLSASSLAPCPGERGAFDYGPSHGTPPPWALFQLRPRALTCADDGSTSSGPGSGLHGRSLSW